MILVDVQVPMLDQVFDFELNEEMEVEKVIKDISLLAAKQEGKGETSLVVSPASLVYNWGEEIRNYTPELSCGL